jgi:hypothetical protein
LQLAVPLRLAWSQHELQTQPWLSVASFILSFLFWWDWT